MVFILTLLYISISLLSPAVLPEFLQGVHILELLGLVIILFCLPKVGTSQLLSHPATYLVTGVLSAATLSTLATGWLGGALDVFLRFVPIVFTFYFVVIGCTTYTRIVVLIYVLCAVAIYISAQGAIAELTGNSSSPYLLSEQVAGSPFYRHRGLGVIADPNDLAQVLVSLLPLLWLYSEKDRWVRKVLLTYVPAAGLVIGIYYTHSRGGILALIAVILFGLKDSVGIIGSSIMAGMFTVGALAINMSGGRGLNQDDGQRVSLWSQALTTFKLHPIFGIGVGNFADYNDMHLTAHNSYVLCLAEMGVVGYFFWLGSIVSAWTGLSAISESEKSVNIHMSNSQYTISSRVKWMNGRLTQSADSLSTSMEARFVHSNSFSNEAELCRVRRSAKVVQTAFVGLLVSGFFITRTYSITFYVLEGIAVALQLVYWEKTISQVAVDHKKLFRKIAYAMITSVTFLYIFIRFHGS